MNTKLRLLRRLWPLVCGLVVGGLLGGLTRSWEIGALFGAASGLYIYWQLHFGQAFPDAAVQSQAHLRPVGLENLDHTSRGTSFPDACDLEQQSELLAQGVSGVGPYSHLGEDPS